MNVLLIQLKRIGDLILTVPAIAALRNHFPEANVSLIVAHGSRELLPAIAGLDRALVTSGDVSGAKPWLAVAKGRFQYCLDFSRTDRSAALTLLSGARKRITYATNRRQPMRQLCYNEFIPSPVLYTHTIDYHLALLAPLGVHSASNELRLNLPQSAEDKADELMKAHGLDDKFIMLHPGSARAEKFWVARRWAEVLNQIQASEPAQVVITGSKSAMEQQHIGRIKAHLQYPALDLSGKLRLLTLAALIKRARLLLTIDSAPMHLAAAFGTPQLALFGPTNPFHWRPRAVPATILHSGTEGPVTTFEPRIRPRPMREISTEAVIDAMQNLLSTRAAPLL